MDGDGGAGTVATWAGVGVVVLAGGGSRRMGADKLAAEVGGRPLLDHVLLGVPAEVPVVVVGRVRVTARPVRWASEEPPGSGPAAAVAAGWRVLRPPADREGGADGDVPTTSAAPAVALVLAGDAPGAPGAGTRLLAALRQLARRRPDRLAAAVGTDPSGHRQPLVAAFTAEALDAATRWSGGAPGLAGRPARALLDGLAVVEVPLSAVEARDVDTPRQLAALQEEARHPRPP